MKILYISHKPIFPTVDGGCVAMANFLKILLSNKHEVKHLTIATNKHPFTISSFPKEIVEKIQPEAVDIDTDVKISAALPYLLKNGSYNVERFFSNQMSEKITETLKSTTFDCVILESLFSTSYLSVIKNNFKGKIFLRSHNVEYKIWEDLKNSTGNWLKKTYLNKLFKDLRKYEVEVLPLLDGIFTISDDDKALYQKTTTTPIETVSLALEISHNLNNDYSAANLFHLGGMDWKPNKEAVERLISLFPSIKEVIPTAQLFVIGKGTENIASNGDESIVLEGFVEELESHCISKGILVTPISSGSGVRIKILEMMSLGIPVITTTKGAQGIDHEKSDCLIIANTNEEIITACVELMSNKKRRIEIGTNAKSYISKHHSIEENSKKLNTLLVAK